MSHPTDDQGMGRVATNTAWLLAAEILSKVASFALLVILARGLGQAELGLFVFAISFFPLFLMFASWGIDTAVIREVSGDRDRISAFFSSGLVLRAVLGFLALALGMAVTPFLVQGHGVLVGVGLIGVALLLDEFSRFVGAVFKAFERIRFHAFVLVVNRLVPAPTTTARVRAPLRPLAPRAHRTAARTVATETEASATAAVGRSPRTREDPVENV